MCSVKIRNIQYKHCNIIRQTQFIGLNYIFFDKVKTLQIKEKGRMSRFKINKIVALKRIKIIGQEEGFPHTTIREV